MQFLLPQKTGTFNKKQTLKYGKLHMQSFLKTAIIAYNKESKFYG